MDEKVREGPVENQPGEATEIAPPQVVAPPIAPPPPPPPPPPAPRPAKTGMGGGKVFLVALFTAIFTSMVILVALPLAFGNNPLDFFRGKAETTVEEVAEANDVPVETVERVALGGQAAVVMATQKLMPAVVNIESSVSAGTAIGSGFIIREDGYIVTNNHVVDGARGIQVSLADGNVETARVIGTDPDTDLAVLKIDAAGLPVAELGNSSTLVVGEVAVAIGSPEGFEQSVTSGIISALHRNLTGSGGTTPLLDVIQTDAAINPGNSGGPLANISGQVIGINTAIVSSSGGNEGIGFAIPIDSAKPVIDQLISTGKVTHPWLGISGTTLSPEVATRFNLTMDNGALVRSVYSGGPADKAGILQGDIIVEMDGQKITSMDDLMLFVRKHQVGDKVEIKLYRGSDPREVEATLTAKPANL